MGKHATAVWRYFDHPFELKSLVVIADGGRWAYDPPRNQFVH